MEENSNTDEQKSPAKHLGSKLLKTAAAVCEMTLSLWVFVTSDWLLDVSVCRTSVAVMCGVGVLLSYRGHAQCCCDGRCSLLFTF